MGHFCEHAQRTDAKMEIEGSIYEGSNYYIQASTALSVNTFNIQFLWRPDIRPREVVCKQETR